MAIVQLAGFPAETMEVIVSVLFRLAFEFGVWSDGLSPLLIVCEEAHNYANADRDVGFRAAREGLSRIAKEGRKHGVFLGLVTQRPHQLDPTLISQCSTVFAMRLGHEDDQKIVRAAVSDSASRLLVVPALARHARGAGDRRRGADGHAACVSRSCRTIASRRSQAAWGGDLDCAKDDRRAIDCRGRRALARHRDRRQASGIGGSAAACSTMRCAFPPTWSSWSAPVSRIDAAARLPRSVPDILQKPLGRDFAAEAGALGTPRRSSRRRRRIARPADCRAPNR